MEIITAEILEEGVRSLLSTLSILKDTFASAIINNFLEAFSHLPELSPYWVLTLIGSAYLAWKLKSWIVGLFVKNLL